MNQYLIENRATFKPLESRIYSVDKSNHYIQLSMSSSRCLEFILTQPNQLVNKYTLLDIGWRNHGIFVTDNSLNQSILNIRRALKSLGIDNDIILTVSRLGYRLSHECQIKVIPHPNLEDNEQQKIHPEDFIEKLSSISKVENKHKRSNSLSPTLFIFAFLTVLFLFLSYLFLIKSPFLSEYNNIGHEVSYIKMDNQLKDRNLFINTDYNISDAKLINIVENIESDIKLNELINSLDGIDNIYINGSYTDYVISLFLCKLEISNVNSLCFSYVLVRYDK